MSKKLSTEEQLPYSERMHKIIDKHSLIKAHPERFHRAFPHAKGAIQLEINEQKRLGKYSKNARW